MKNKIYTLLFLLFLPLHNTIPIGEKRRSPSLSLPPKKRQLNQPTNSLLQAIKKNDLSQLSNIIERHPDRAKFLNTPDSQGRLPLELACAQGSKRAVLLLLEYGASPKIADNKGQRSLHTSIYRGAPNITKTLLERGAEATAPEGTPSPLGLTVYLQSKNACYYKIARYLLQSGADPNQIDHTGKSPYQSAANKCNQKLIHLMHQYAADPLKLSREGKSALEYALSAKHSKIAHIIEKNISEDEKNYIEDLLEEQQSDPITGDTLSEYSTSRLIALKGKVYKKQTIIHHVLSKIGTDNGPRDPFDNTPISKETLLRIAAYTKIPYQEIDYTQSSPASQSLVAMARLLAPREGALSSIHEEAQAESETEDESDSDSDREIDPFELMSIGDQPNENAGENSNAPRQEQYNRETLELIQAEVRTLQARLYDRLRLFNPQLAESIYPQILPNISMVD